MRLLLRARVKVRVRRIWAAVRVRVRVLTRGEWRTSLVAGVVLAEGAPCWPDAVGACSVSCSMRPPPSPG